MKRPLFTAFLLGLMPLPFSFAQDASHAHKHHHAPAAAQPQQPGQAAFAALSEVVALLEADPKTDWSKVDITRLRDHLIDMDEVVMKAAARVEADDRAIRITYTGAGRTLEAIRRMIPAHARMMNGYRDWTSTTEATKDGVVWVLSTASPDERTRIRALGPFGLLTLDAHHGPHHLAMARGVSVHEH